MDELLFKEKFPELNENQKKWLLSDIQRIIAKYADNEVETVILNTAIKNYIQGDKPILVEPRE